MTACCCRLTQPANSSTTNTSGGGSESHDAKRAARGCGGARPAQSVHHHDWPLFGQPPSTGCVECANYRAILPGPSSCTGRGRRNHPAALPPGFRNPGFNLLEPPRDVLREQLVTSRRHEHVVFDANTEAPLRKVDARFDRDYCPDRQRLLVTAHVVHVEPDEVAETVYERCKVSSFVQ